ncbi:MAG: hypothetical protein AAGM67_18750, partial [Bacteroidota bacterium]
VKLESLRIILESIINDYQKHLEAGGDRAYQDSILAQYQVLLALEDYVQGAFYSNSTREYYAAESSQIYEGAIAATLSMSEEPDMVEAFRISEKSKSRRLAEKIQATAQKSTFNLPDSLFQQEANLAAEVAEVETKLYQAESVASQADDSLIRSLNRKLFELRNVQTSLLDHLQTYYPDYYRLRYSHEVISLAEVQDSLLGQVHDALVEYFVGDSMIYTFVVLPDTFHLLSQERDFSMLEWSEEFRCALLAEQDTALHCTVGYAQTAHRLYENLFAAVDSLLPPMASVLIVPDGVLGYLSFETLLTEPAAENETYASYSYLLGDHPISYAYSATLQQEMQRKYHQS